MRLRGPGTQVQVMVGNDRVDGDDHRRIRQVVGEGPRGFQRGPADRRALERVVSGRKHLQQLPRASAPGPRARTRSGRGPTRPVGASSRRSCARSDQRSGPASRLARRRTPAPRRRHPSRCIRRPAGQACRSLPEPALAAGPGMPVTGAALVPSAAKGAGRSGTHQGCETAAFQASAGSTGGRRHAALAPCPRILGGGQVSDAPGRRPESGADQGFGQRPAPPTRPSARAVEIPGCGRRPGRAWPCPPHEGPARPVPAESKPERSGSLAMRSRPRRQRWRRRPIRRQGARGSAALRAMTERSRLTRTACGPAARDTGRRPPTPPARAARAGHWEAPIRGVQSRHAQPPVDLALLTASLDQSGSPGQYGAGLS